MNVARHRPVSCVYDGKIYVIGGCEGSETEVFDTNTQTWELCNCRSSIEESQGKIYFCNFNKRIAYDPTQDEWESFKNISALGAKFECVIENVSYRFDNYGTIILQWFDIKDGNWKEVKGLDSLIDKYKQLCLRFRKLVRFGGKLLLIWEGCMNHAPNDVGNIWCAEIMFEKSDGGEMWGNVEWDDVILTVSRSCKLLRCLAVSV